MKTLDELFNELPPHRQETVAEKARRLAKAEEERQREIRQGLRDANGDWIDDSSGDIATLDEDTSGDDDEPL